MIINFQDQATADIFQNLKTRQTRRIPQELHRKAYLMLQVLASAPEAQVMATPPGNRLHKLSGNLASFWSVSLNDQYRLIFRFEGGNAYDVRITDYH